NRGAGGAQRPRVGRRQGRVGHDRQAVARRRLPAPRGARIHRCRHGGGRMTLAVRQSWQVNLRCLRAFVRQPAWVAIALTPLLRLHIAHVEPFIWPLLFGAFFKRVLEIPGFEGGSYIVFLTPGVAVMTAVMSAGWNGMGFIEDMDKGVLDRMLVTPLWRGAL